MDFRRIEQIFFVAFFCLNLFLLTLFIPGRMEEKTSDSLKQDVIESRLDKDKITYPSLPIRKETGVYLSAISTDFNEELEKLKIANPSSFMFLNHITIGEKAMTVTPKYDELLEEKTVTTELKNFLNNENEIFYGNQYRYLAEFSNFDTQYPQLKYVQSYASLPIIDDSASIVFSLSKNDKLWKVDDYKQTHITQIAPLREKQALFSGRDAVTMLYNNSKIPAKTTILYVKLGYYKILSVKEKNVYVPVWFVGLKINQGTILVERVNAISNTLITANSKVDN